MHSNAKLLFEKYAIRYFSPGMRVLEIGPETNRRLEDTLSKDSHVEYPSWTFQSLLANRSLTWETIDMYESPRLTYRSISEYTFPIPDNTFDVVLSGNVIEHVRKIWVWIKELARVTKVGGLVITINPCSWPYHEIPVDCWRAYPEGMRALYDEARLEVLYSTWESLESVSSKRRLPGRSSEWQPPKLRLAYRLLDFIGFPHECSYDTITIGRKLV